MGIHIDAALVRKGWKKGTAAGVELGDARTHIGTARGANLGDFASYLSGVCDDLDGVLEVGEQVIGELGTGVESCIATYQSTDGASSGGFNALDPS